MFIFKYDLSADYIHLQSEYNLMYVCIMNDMIQVNKSSQWSCLLLFILMVNKSTKININIFLSINSWRIYEVLMGVMSSPLILYTGMIKWTHSFPFSTNHVRDWNYCQKFILPIATYSRLWILSWTMLLKSMRNNRKPLTEGLFSDKGCF